ncbi:unnamed protein product [Cochlearia groenlandica]
MRDLSRLIHQAMVPPCILPLKPRMRVPINHNQSQDNSHGKKCRISEASACASVVMRNLLMDIAANNPNCLSWRANMI